MSTPFLALRARGLATPLPTRTPQLLSSHLHHHPRHHRTHPFSSSAARNTGILGLDRDARLLRQFVGLHKSHAAARAQNKLRDTSKFKTPPQPTGYRQLCPEPLKAIDASQRQALDPTGARGRLFDATNLEGAKVGDILLVRQRDGDPFAGVCINIRRRGVDTGILLRNQLTRVGVEMWFKVFSPNVEGIEIVQRRRKRARRARLYYMRQPKHDVGSVENVVQQYIRQRQALRSGERAKGRDANSNRKHGMKNKSK